MGFAQTVRVPSYGGGGWPNRHITFIATEKVPLALFTVYEVEGLTENVKWGRRGWLKMLEYRHMGEGVKNCSKNRHMLFERSLTIFLHGAIFFVLRL